MTTEDTDQSRVTAYLASPATHGGAHVERMSTHGAHIFLAGERAYKLKRAVKFDFMDFSTVAKRRAALDAELRINAATAPGLYIEVAPIRENADGGLSFAGEGPPIEWVLVMRRFPQDAVLDHIASRQGLSDQLVDDLTDAVVAMHKRAEVMRAVGASFAAMAVANIPELAAIPTLRARAARLERCLRRECAALTGHFEIRGQEGFVRRCHGDLHLRNIVLLDGRPVPFDALEFDPDLATGDVYYDLAFLLMDLEHRGLRAAANRLLNRYVVLTDDVEGLRALPLFLSVRATVRAKVAALTAASAASEDTRRSHLTDAARYLDLANCYLPVPTPCLVGIGGLSGTGKSTVAVGLAPHVEPAPGALVLRSDVLRKRLSGVGNTERLPPAAYSRAANTQVYDALMAGAARALQAGRSVVVDAVFADVDARTRLEQAAAENGARFVGLWLDSPLATRLGRIGQRRNDASDADSTVAMKQEEYQLGTMAWSRIDARGTPEDVQRRARAASVYTHAPYTPSPAG